MIILLTGLPGTGKTTVVENFLQRYQGNCFWILSKELRNEVGERIGFEAMTSNGEKGVFAHKEIIKSEHMVGSYHVDLEIIDSLFTQNILRELESPKRLLVIDEIGRMEMLSKNFERAIDLSFETDIQILATIRHGDEWTEKYKQRGNVTVIEVTHENREQLPDVLLEKFTSAHI